MATNQPPYIIYVDNDPDDRLLLQDAFASNPAYSLVTLESGFELFEYLERVPDGHYPASSSWISTCPASPAGMC